MPVNILMPALSPTMEKGNLAKWLKKEGDVIKSGDILAEIETDKATMEVEAVDEGILARIVVQEGTQDVPVNDVIAVIAAEGEDVATAGVGAAAAPLPAAPPPPSPQGGGMGAPGAPVLQSANDAPSVGAAPSSPLAGEVAASVAGGGAGTGSSSAHKLFASPLAKRIARDAGLDLAAITGTGPHGRIVEKDVKAAMADGGAKATSHPSASQPPSPAGGEGKAPAAPAASPPAPGAFPIGMAESVVRKLFQPGSFTEVPHDSMRKIIARRLMESKLTVPHFYLTLDCELDALLRLRTEINAAAPEREGKPAYKLSVNDMVIKALAMALRAVPEANVTWTDSAMLKHAHADVGVAVSIPGGLITPVIRDACHKTLSQISNEMKDLAARAKARKLQPSEFQGGTTAVSNLGMFGIKDFAAVINPPHATILAVGAGEPRAVVRNGAVVAATVMSVTLSTDHRAVDGALGAELLQSFRGYIEKPMGMLV